MNFVYTSHAVIEMKSLDELCTAARMLGLNHLKQICMNKFSDAAVDIEHMQENNNNDKVATNNNMPPSADHNAAQKGDEEKNNISTNTRDKLREALKRKISLEQEMEYDEQGVYICKFCSKMFQSSDLLQMHEREKHSRKDGDHPSEADNEVSDFMLKDRMVGPRTSFFDSNLDSDDQLHIHEGDDDSNLSSSMNAGLGGGSLSPSPGSKGQDSSNRKRFFCDLCDSSFTRRDNLKTHKKAKHEGKCLLSVVFSCLENYSRFIILLE